ncbi:MAG TPA: hypothetical protein VMX11_09880 [Actinomycetes bacterium]|nr:hypothetical protein [Actinomycetes bacterium]
MKDANKDRDQAKAHKRAKADASCALRKLSQLAIAKGKDKEAAELDRIAVRVNKIAQELLA